MAFAAWNMVATLVLPFQEIMVSWDKDWGGISNCTFSFLYEQTAPEIQGTQSFGILADALLESFHNVYLYRYSHGSESFALQASEYILSLCSSEGHKLQYVSQPPRTSLLDARFHPELLSTEWSCFQACQRASENRTASEDIGSTCIGSIVDQAPQTSSHVESRGITAIFVWERVFVKAITPNHAQSREHIFAMYLSDRFFLLDFTYDTFPLTNLVEKKLHFFTRKYFQWNVTTWFIRLSIWLQHTLMVS
jgi:hypothetical protein